MTDSTSSNQTIEISPFQKLPNVAVAALAEQLNASDLLALTLTSSGLRDMFCFSVFPIMQVRGVRRIVESPNSQPSASDVDTSENAGESWDQAPAGARHEIKVVPHFRYFHSGELRVPLAEDAGEPASPPGANEKASTRTLIIHGESLGCLDQLEAGEWRRLQNVVAADGLHHLWRDYRNSTAGNERETAEFLMKTSTLKRISVEGVGKRCRDGNIEGNGDYDVSQILLKASEQMPHLERLSISFKYHDYVVPTSSGIIGCDASPVTAPSSMNVTLYLHASQSLVDTSPLNALTFRKLDLALTAWQASRIGSLTVTHRWQHKGPGPLPRKIWKRRASYKYPLRTVPKSKYNEMLDCTLWLLRCLEPVTTESEDAEHAAGSTTN